MTLPDNIDQTIKNMAQQIQALAETDPLIVGIHTGGALIAEAINRLMENSAPTASIDISFYRDDFTRIGFNPVVNSTQIDIDIEDRNVVLVDDVLHTGRTIRAAMNELFAYGRPKNIRLAVLVDRGGREIPIQADIIGYNMALEPNQRIKLLSDQGKFQFQLQNPDRSSS